MASIYVASKAAAALSSPTSTLMTIEAFTLQLLYKTMRNGCVGDIEFLSETNDFSYFLDVDQTLIYLKSDVHANLRKILMGISNCQT